MLQRKPGVLLCLALLLGLAAACNRPAPETPANARPAYAQGDTVEVTGVLVDTRCFHLDKAANRADDHLRPEGRVPGCGAACARQGIPVAVLEGGQPDGYVWVLSFSPQVFADYMGKTVRVRGDFRADGIMVPLRVEMQTGDTWTVIM